jgi:UDP-glucose 4-epimerase
MVRRALRQYQPVGVIHLAAHKDVAESVANPLRYYRDNLDGLRVLLQGVTAYEVGHVLFSSSAAVYGTPAACPVAEDAPTAPENAYGRSKLIGEWMLRDAAASAAFTWAALRYFNVAGAAAPGLRDHGATNLVPRLLRAAERREPARIYGGDYPTPDGTAVRDYIHVADIADAHVCAATALAKGELTGEVLNIGRGVGVSVREMVDAIGRALDNPLPYVVDPRRPGDPAEVVAAADRIRDLLGWRARHDLDDIVRSATDRIATSDATAGTTAAVGTTATGSSAAVAV